MSIPDLETYLPKVISWRRDLHMHPELGLQEVRTSNLIADLLTKFGLDVQRILLVQRFWEHCIPINLAKQLSCAQIWTHFQSKMPKMYPTAHKFQVSVMPAAMMPILQIFLVLRTIFPIIALNFVEQ